MRRKWRQRTAAKGNGASSSLPRSGSSRPAARGWMIGDGLDARLQLQLHKLVWGRTGEECDEVTTGGKPIGIALVSGGMTAS